jgi:hypothetical protein
VSTNDVIVIEKILAQTKSDEAPDMPDSDYFEIFCANQILKDYDLTYDEVRSGIVDGGGDGGMDSMYLFVNGELLLDDEADLSGLKRNVSIDLVIIQSKTSTSFREEALNKLISSARDLLDLGKSLDGLASVYNAGVLSVMNRFRQAYTVLAARLPTLRISYHYATKGLSVDPKVKRKVEELEQRIRKLFSSVTFEFAFLGASDLLNLFRRQPKTVYELKVAQTPISAGGAFVALIALPDFNSFICDDHGRLMRSMFESNVRDYQGTNQVNEEIFQTLKDSRPQEDFWWLNNGVTVLASGAALSGNILRIENPQIVNGLQTSTEIHRWFESGGTQKDARAVLVRVIAPPLVETQDRIIKANNSQTPIAPASLRATEKIHRDIEEIFRAHGFYYDRRKNHYKNEGKPIERIISIPYLAQAVMAIALSRPDTARARPSSLLKQDEDYNKVFSDKHPIGLYVGCVALMKRVDQLVRSCSLLPERRDQTNLRFYVAMEVARAVVPNLDPTRIASVDVASIPEDRFTDSIRTVKSFYDALGANDQVAKGPELLKQLNTSATEPAPAPI